MKQHVKVATRGNNVLDWCLVNKPKEFAEPVQLPNIGSSDHFAVLINQIDVNPKTKTSSIPTYRREMKDSNMRAFGRWICNKSWSEVLSSNNCENKFNLFYKEIIHAINTCIFAPKKAKNQSVR